jgi:hypothetical protein
MARYQLLRPSPVKVIPRRVRRQDPATSAIAAPNASEQPEAEEEKEEEEGPESPDSPSSSPSTVGAASESEDSDSDSEDEKEPPSPAESSTLAPISQTPASEKPASSSLPAASGVTRPGAISSAPGGLQASPISGSANIISSKPSVASQTPSPKPAITLSFSSQGNLAAAPQVTDVVSSSITIQPTTTTTPVQDFSTRLARPSNPQTTSVASPPPVPAQSESAGQSEPPQRSSPQHEKTLITKGGVAAAITLSIIGKPFT